MPTPSEHLKQVHEYAAQQDDLHWRFADMALKRFFLDRVSLDIAFGVADDRGRARTGSERLGLRDSLLRALYSEHFALVGKPKAARMMISEYRHFLRVEGDATRLLDEMPARYHGKRWANYWGVARLDVKMPGLRRLIDIL